MTMECKCKDRSGTTMVECCNQCGGPLAEEGWQCGPLGLQRIAELEEALKVLLEASREIASHGRRIAVPDFVYYSFEVAIGRAENALTTKGDES